MADFKSSNIKNASEVVINPATEETQQEVLMAVAAISGTTPYNYVQSDTDSTYKYYGYASSTGWRFKRKTLDTGIWMVASGSGDYATNWANRGSKTYGYV